MSANLKEYMDALEMARKLNPAAEVAAKHLQIGARRRPMIGPRAASGGVRYPYRRGVGQSSAGNGNGNGNGCPPSVDYSCMVQPTMLPVGAPVGGPCPPEFLCDCDLVGLTTLGTAPIAAGAARTLTLTDFDAVALQAVAIWFTAFTADADDPNNLIANPVVEVPLLLSDVEIGQNGQLRASGIPNGLNSAAFAATREPVCVDWAEFRSQNGQELTLVVNNIVADSTIHVFFVFWTNVLQ